jgi:anti-anti-sigma regulatory factor
MLSSGSLIDRNTAFLFGTQFASLLTGGGSMLKVNMDSVGEAAIVECEGSISGGDEALQLYDAVTGRAADRVIVIDLSRVSVTVGKGLSMLLFLERWTRHRGIELKLFNPCPAVRHELEDAGSLFGFKFASLSEVMAIVIAAGNRQPIAA